MNRKIHTYGFTIVELLIVIVVIAILAAITIVAFNGVTARANSSSAQAAASTVIKKIEAYNAENSSYPTHQQPLLGPENEGRSWKVTNVTIDPSVMESQPETGPETVNIFACEGVGAKVRYWKYDENSWAELTAGNTATCSQSPFGNMIAT